MLLQSWYKTDINSPVRVIELPGNLFTADSQGNLIGVEIVDRGSPVSLNEGVFGYIIRADDETVILTGSVSGNRASIVLPEIAYSVAGPIHIVIKVGRTTVGAFTGYVRRSTTDAIIDPGHVIPDINELLSKIADCEAATSSANTAAANANSKATLANNAATSANTAASNANSKASLADTAATNANNKASLADEKATAANNAASAANTAATNANNKATLANEKATAANNAASAANTAATNANNKASLADTAATNANNKASLADTAATNANNKASAANTAANTANAAAEKIDDMTVAAQGLAAGASPTATISEVSGHKHILFGIPKGDKGDRGSAGKDFHIAFTFQSVAAMEAYSGDIDLYDYCMIDTGSVEDVETGRLYCYEDDDEWHYIGDLSGAQGIRGETGTGIDSIVLNQDYTLTITMTDGTYYTTASIRGAPGPTGDTGRGISGITLNQDYTLTITYTDGTSDTTTSVRGATGNGIASVVLNQDYTLTITMTDGNTYTTGSIRGQIGLTPDFTIGTVTTLPEGSSATAIITGTAEAPVLNLGIPKGDTGSAENVYANTIPMSSSDSTKISEALDDKVDANQGSANAGKALGIDSTGAVVPVPFSGDDFTGATASSSGVHGYVPAPAAGDQGKALFGDGTWKQVADPADFDGATASAAGTHGLVPAPAAGDQLKVLTGSGDWEVAPGARIVQVSVTVTNTSGAYTTTIQDDRISADMKALSLEITNPNSFNDKITVTTAAGSVTLSSNDVSGTSVAKINLIKAATNTSVMTSEEFDILDAAKVDKTDFYATEMPMSSSDSTKVATAIGSKQNSTDNSLSTTAKTVVGAINENTNAISSNSSAITNLNNKFFTQISSGTNLNNITTTGFYGVLNGTIAASLVNTPITSGGFVLEVLNKGGTVVQTAKTGDQLFTRGQYSSGFDSWHEFATKSDLKSKEITIPQVSAGGYQTIDETVTSAGLGIIAGFIINSTLSLVLTRLYMPNKTTISVRVRNVDNSAVSNSTITVYYM